jgi:hypothetical protein
MSFRLCCVLTNVLQLSECAARDFNGSFQIARKIAAQSSNCRTIVSANSKSAAFG